MIGAGIIGICCGIRLLDRGFQVTLYDPEPPGSMTSFGNAGGFGFTDVVPASVPGVLCRVPGWLLDSCGPLSVRPGHFPSMIPWLWRFVRAGRCSEVERLSRALSSLLQPGLADTRELVGRAGLKSLFTERGALTVYRTHAAFCRDRTEWRIRSDQGVRMEELGADDIRRMEPALEQVECGWYTPDWCNTTDPHAFARGLADCFIRSGGRMERERVASLRTSGKQVGALELGDGRSVPVERVVIAAGAWSEPFCRQLGERVLLQSERGYNTTLPSPGVVLERQVIFGEEKFVISAIRNGLRIGGTAEFAGLRAKPDWSRCDRLVDIARRYLPALDDRDGTRWMGHRPATPDSVPVIGPSRRMSNAWHAFGHGHYGLTMAATTGRLIACMVCGDSTGLDPAPFSISRFN